MDKTDTSVAEVIADLAKKSGAEVVTLKLDTPIAGLPDSVPALLNRQTGAVSSVKQVFDTYRDHPERKTGTAKVTTLESFIELVNRHSTGDSVIFADTDWKDPSLTAVIDYHAQTDAELKLLGRADYGKHRVHYAFPLSEEWQAWVAQNGKIMSQKDFALWIEDHIAELSAPDIGEADANEEQFGYKTAHPNELKQLSRGLQIRVETRIKSNVMLQSGEGEIIWEEEHKDSLGNRLVVPGLFMLKIAPFFMGEVCRIPVRLRYKAVGGTASWYFQLYRPDLHITEQILRDLETATAETGLPSYQGAPEMRAMPHEI